MFWRLGCCFLSCFIIRDKKESIIRNNIIVPKVPLIQLLDVIDRSTYLPKRSLDKIFLIGYIPSMAWDVEYTEVFDGWWGGLDESEQIDVDAVIGLLEIKGPNLGFPYSSA